MKKYFLDTVDSTNSEAKRMIRDGAGSDFAVIAKAQTSGRGQFARRFFSPPDTGLYMSVALKLKSPLNDSFLTRAAAVAVCRSIERTYGIGVSIKPINDILFGGGKVCGILVETCASYGSGEYFAVFGIGINLSMPALGFPEELRGKAAFLFETATDPGALIEEIIVQLLAVAAEPDTPALKSEYERRIKRDL